MTSWASWRDVHELTRSSSASWCARRSASVAKRGSVAHSGLPTTCANADHSASSRTVITHHWSSPAHGYTPHGAPSGLRFPCASTEPGTRLSWRTSSERWLTTASACETRMWRRPPSPTHANAASAPSRAANWSGKKIAVLGEVAVGVGIAPEPRLRADAARVRAEAAPPTPRPPVAEELAAHHHDPRIGAAEGLQIEPEVVERAGSEVLDHHVAHRHEPQDQLPSFRRAEIDPEAALVAVDRHELRRHVRRTAEHAALVGEGAALHADHIGTLVAEELAGLGSGHELRELEDAQPRERALTGVRHAPRPRTAARRTATPRVRARRVRLRCRRPAWARRGGSRRVGRRTRSSPRAARRRGRRRSWWRRCRGRASARWRRAPPATSPA